MPRRVRRTVGTVEDLLDQADSAAAGGPPLPGVLDRDTALHEARKAAKQARYAAEAAVPVGGSGATALAAAMEDLQELLGEQHDSVVTRQLLRTTGMQAHAAGENAVTYGVLHGAEAAACPRPRGGAAEGPQGAAAQEDRRLAQPPSRRQSGSTRRRSSTSRSSAVRIASSDRRAGGSATTVPSW